MAARSPDPSRNDGGDAAKTSPAPQQYGATMPPLRRVVVHVGHGLPPPRSGARAAIPRVPFAAASRATDTSVAMAAARTAPGGLSTEHGRASSADLGVVRPQRTARHGHRFRGRSHACGQTPQPPRTHIRVRVWHAFAPERSPTCIPSASSLRFFWGGASHALQQGKRNRGALSPLFARRSSRHHRHHRSSRRQRARDRPPAKATCLALRAA